MLFPVFSGPGVVLVLLDGCFVGRCGVCSGVLTGGVAAVCQSGGGFRLVIGLQGVEGRCVLVFLRVACGGCDRCGAVWLVAVRLVCGVRGLPCLIGVLGGAVGAWPLVICVPAWGGLPLALLGLGRCGVAFPVRLGCLSWCAPCHVLWRVFPVWGLLVVLWGSFAVVLLPSRLWVRW